MSSFDEVPSTWGEAALEVLREQERLAVSTEHTAVPKASAAVPATTTGQPDVTNAARRPASWFRWPLRGKQAKPPGQNPAER